MQQELNRIMNKDLSKLDERLFGGLQKLESIDSTIQNLGEFQQFLLQQITQFQQKSKEKNHDKQVTQVIEQNCMTLRQSILKAVPEIQESTSRLRQSILSPINGFRSTTGFHKSKGQHIQQTKTPELAPKMMQRNISQSHLQLKQQSLQQLSRNHLMYSKIQRLNQQLKELKDQHKKLKQANQQVKKCLKEEFEAKLAMEFSKITDEIVKLKDQIEELKLIIQKHGVQNQSRQTKPVAKNEIMLSFNGNQQKDLSQEQPKQQKQYKTFMDKMKSDFSTKIIQLSTLDNTRDLSSFRQTSNAKGNIEDYKKLSEPSFHSVQLTREQILREKDVNVPKLLRRNSILNEPHISNCVSHQSSALKTKQPLHELYNQHIFAHTSHTKSKSSLEQNQPSHSCSKKSNHDLMRKPKSNFFKNPLSNQENTAPFFDSSAKIQFNERASTPIQTSNPTNLTKKRSQSKQKLKIFSLL